MKKFLLKTCKNSNCYNLTINPNFCSQTCAAIFNNKKYKKRIRKIYYCETCGNESKYRRKFCSKECNPLLSKAIQLNDLLYNTIGSNKRTKIQGRARSVYKLSGKPMICYNCKYDKHVEICHIKAISSFIETTLISEVNDINNLVALCPNCHWEYDHLELALR